MQSEEKIRDETILSTCGRVYHLNGTNGIWIFMRITANGVLVTKITYERCQQKQCAPKKKT